MCKDLFIYYNERSLKTVSLDTFIRSHWSFFVNFYTLKTKKCNNSHITFGVGQLCYLIWHHRSNPVSKTRFPCLFVFLLVSLSCSLSFVYLLATARFAALFWSASLDVWWFLLLRRSVIHQNTTLKSVHGCFRCFLTEFSWICPGNLSRSLLNLWGICGESVGNLPKSVWNLSGAEIRAERRGPGEIQRGRGWNLFSCVGLPLSPLAGGNDPETPPLAGDQAGIMKHRVSAFKLAASQTVDSSRKEPQAALKKA